MAALQFSGVEHASWLPCSPRPGVAGSITSDCSLTTGSDGQSEGTQPAINCQEVKLNFIHISIDVFIHAYKYPESKSWPLSLRSAAQSSDRQFFSKKVWNTETYTV